MKDYIEREAVLNIAFEWCPDDDGSVGKTGDLRDMLDELEVIPTADVRPVVRGKWIRGDSWSEGVGMGESYGFYYSCSVCKKKVKEGYNNCRMNFCPNCGANMRGEQL